MPIQGVLYVSVISFIRNAPNASFTILAALLLSTSAKAQPLELGPVSVNDDADHNALNHGVPVAAMPSASLQDTPQTVNVVDSATMKQQGTTSLDEALRNVPGITIAIGEGGTLAGDQFKINGFDAKDDIYLDGLRDFAAYTRDSFDYEEVQVLRGPSGLMFGRGTTGGAINTLTKTPFLEDKNVLHGEGGNGSHARATADLNYQLSDTSAARLNLMFTSAGTVDRDLTYSNRWGVAPSISFGLGTDTVLNLNYIHQQGAQRPDYGVPVAVQPDSVVALPVTEFGVPRNTFLGYNADRDDNSADLLTAKLTHVASDWLSIENDARIAWYSRYFQYTTVDRCDTTAATNFCANTLFGATPAAALGGIGGNGPYNQNSRGAQDVFTATANFHAGGFRNTLIAGFDAGFQKADRTIYAYALPGTSQFTYLLNGGAVSRANIGVSLYDPVHAAPSGYNVVLPNPANVAGTNDTLNSVVQSSGNSTDLAFFVTDRLWLADAWSIIAGVRVDQFNASFKSVTVAGTATPANSPSTLANPRASLVYEPDQNTTLYFSYGRSAVPQGTSIVGSPTPITTANQALAPEIGESFELGGKYSLLNGQLGLTGSVFQEAKVNATITDPLSGNVQLQSGQRQRVQGYEISATGKVIGDLSLIAAYTWLNPVVTYDLSCTTTALLVCNLNPYTIGSQISFVPKHAAALWADYSLHEFLPGLSIGAGAVYQSKLVNAITTTGAAPNPTGVLRVATIPQTIEFDGMAAYELDKTWRLQVNVNNIGDRLNYSQSFGNRGTPAPGRTVIAALEARF
jgi:catecholate siderophore receptor